MIRANENFAAGHLRTVPPRYLQIPFAAPTCGGKFKESVRERPQLLGDAMSLLFMAPVHVQEPRDIRGAKCEFYYSNS